MVGHDFSRRDFLRSVGLGAATLAVSQPLLGRELEKRKPNIIFIYIDDLGWKDVGFMGSRYYETPSLDGFAKQGMVFRSAYANAPNCAPSRACLLSGQYSPRHGVYTVGKSVRGPAHMRKLIPTPNKRTLDPGVVTIAEALKPAGYVSASIGKWHVGQDPANGPRAQGFDVNIAGNRAGSPKSYFSPYKNKDLEDGPKGEYLTDRLTSEALAFIDANKSRPFFLYLPHYAVHTPLQAQKALVEKYTRKQASAGQSNPKYAAMVESMDAGVGRILAKLDELNLAENTVIFFFSDNGGYAGATSMTPLRGFKGMLYEGGIRVPMVVRWPGRVPPGSVCETPVIGTDFYPTMLEIAGAPKPPGHRLDGESLLPLLEQRGSLKRKAIFWHFPAYLQAGRGVKGPWRTTPAGAVRQGDWKLIEFFEDGRLELYNLKDDIGERHDLAESHPQKTKALHDALRRWRTSLNAPVPTQANPKYNPDAGRGKPKENVQPP